MAKNKYYAVKNGRQIGIFDNWADCKDQVYGFSGAIYKGFPTLDEAKIYLEGQESRRSEGYETEEDLMDEIEDNQMIAYVDGSNKEDLAFSWGIVTFCKKLGRKDINGMSTNEEQAKYRNIAGELSASVNAIKFAIDNKMDKITIYHDYSGIRHWALGEWKTRNKLSKAYKEFFDKAKEYIEIEFVKVDGHTGDRFNEEADVLAKKALGIM